MLWTTSEIELDSPVFLGTPEQKIMKWNPAFQKTGIVSAEGNSGRLMGLRPSISPPGRATSWAHDWCRCTGLHSQKGSSLEVDDWKLLSSWFLNLSNGTMEHTLGVWRLSSCVVLLSMASLQLWGGFSAIYLPAHAQGPQSPSTPAGTWHRMHSVHEVNHRLGLWVPLRASLTL